MLLVTLAQRPERKQEAACELVIQYRKPHVTTEYGTFSLKPTRGRQWRPITEKGILRSVYEGIF
jgi:hypothetical protein